ncbi:hypothetical protein PtA15_6A244 [Puccinia triticina]|uniref:Uncharacterized protein n=1 Tax=Puccinia triticina TaxID=208348 RepID=A0ABY7CNB0_9BASI|nr:uncharacterized protein PtA15_6A244 [Puccinia triticina]WAQ85616.1 hypothetical protein PtA15_6A244 [Puccinia triticina]WAR55495.1 hypothetical protein PtB15_6B236 [Puccinia triticina]
MQHFTLIKLLTVISISSQAYCKNIYECPTAADRQTAAVDPTFKPRTAGYCARLISAKELADDKNSLLPRIQGFDYYVTQATNVDSLGKFSCDGKIVAKGRVTTKFCSTSDLMNPALKERMMTKKNMNDLATIL